MTSISGRRTMIAIWPMCSPSKARSPRPSPISCRPKFPQAKKRRSRKPPTTDLAAYDLYLRAQALFADTRTRIHAREKLPQAARLLDEAVARDPHFLLAWCLLSRVHGLPYRRATTTPRPVSNWLMRRCKAAVAPPTGCGRSPPRLGEYYYHGFRDYERARMS